MDGGQGAAGAKRAHLANQEHELHGHVAHVLRLTPATYAPAAYHTMMYGPVGMQT